MSKKLKMPVYWAWVGDRWRVCVNLRHWSTPALDIYFPYDGIIELELRAFCAFFTAMIRKSRRAK